MKVFEHVKIDLGYDDLVAETTPTGRKYVDPDGNTYLLLLPYLAY